MVVVGGHEKDEVMVVVTMVGAMVMAEEVMAVVTMVKAMVMAKEVMAV